MRDRKGKGIRDDRYFVGPSLCSRVLLHPSPVSLRYGEGSDRDIERGEKEREKERMKASEIPFHSSIPPLVPTYHLSLRPHLIRSLLSNGSLPHSASLTRHYQERTVPS